MDHAAKNNRISRKTKGHSYPEEETQHPDLRLQVFDHLLVLAPVENPMPDENIIWICQCDCGNTAYVSTCNLVCGYTKSCGCNG